MTLSNFNSLPIDQSETLLAQCCASRNWVLGMQKNRPFRSATHIHDDAASIWSNLSETDYLQAFDAHPKIGDPDSLKAKYRDTHSVASGEQSGVNVADDQLIQELMQANQIYLDKFGFIFIICATGKSAGEMLQAIKQRLSNNRQQELHIAAQEQLKITHIRIDKILIGLTI